MKGAFTLNSVNHGRWTELVGKGTANAMLGLSRMIGQEIHVTSFSLRRIPVVQIADLVGGPEVTSVGIYLTATGSANGHIMLVYDPRIACAFVDLLMGQPPNTTRHLGELERSALGEMGNIIGSFFLSALADETGLDLRPSPPAVMMDMAGALLDIVAADILLTQDEAFVAEATFHTADREIAGMFFVIPSEGLVNALVQWGRTA
ncbi:MAG TPA: chemotaxis protein CheC [Dehalococcoidia bacterium]|nr:chemotaxis protein CheC [Dehalococcoidia bacterium]